MSEQLILRTDANTTIGTGHLMRCLSLAQGWKANGGGATFITACESELLRQRVQAEGFQIVKLKRHYPESDDWETTSRVIADHPDSWVVLDGYHFGSAYQRHIKETGHRLLVIDDMAHLDYYDTDILLNQNINADQMVYACGEHTQLLLGNRYILLGSKYSVYSNWRRQTPEIAANLLITLGGSDPENQTFKVMQAIQDMKINGFKAVVVVGAGNPNLSELRLFAKDLPMPVQVVFDVDNMPELMAWADLAVSAAGTTCLEMAFMRLPALLIIAAENQKRVAAGLQDAGVALNLGWHNNLPSEQIENAIESLAISVDTRRKISQRGRHLVDGKGCERVLAELLNS